MNRVKKQRKDYSDLIGGIVLCVVLLSVLAYGWYRSDRETAEYFRSPQHQALVLENAGVGDKVEWQGKTLTVLRTADSNLGRILFFDQEGELAGLASSLAEDGAKLVSKAAQNR